MLHSPMMILGLAGPVLSSINPAGDALFSADGAAVAPYAQMPFGAMQRTDLTAGEKLVFVAIADRIGENSRAWPGIRALARDCGLSRSCTLRAVQGLEKAGLISVRRAPKTSKDQRNRYRLTSPGKALWDTPRDRPASGTPPSRGRDSTVPQANHPRPTGGPPPSRQRDINNQVKQPSKTTPPYPPISPEIFEEHVTSADALPPDKLPEVIQLALEFLGRPYGPPKFLANCERFASEHGIDTVRQALSEMKADKKPWGRLGFVVLGIVKDQEDAKRQKSQPKRSAAAMERERRRAEKAAGEYPEPDLPLPIIKV